MGILLKCLPRPPEPRTDTWRGGQKEIVLCIAGAQPAFIFSPRRIRCFSPKKSVFVTY